MVLFEKPCNEQSLTVSGICVQMAQTVSFSIDTIFQRVVMMLITIWLISYVAQLGQWWVNSTPTYSKALPDFGGNSTC